MINVKKKTMLNGQEHDESCKKTNSFDLIWLYTVELMKNTIREDFNAKPERIYRKYYSEGYFTIKWLKQMKTLTAKHRILTVWKVSSIEVMGVKVFDKLINRRLI